MELRMISAIVFVHLCYFLNEILASSVNSIYEGKEIGHHIYPSKSSMIEVDFHQLILKRIRAYGPSDSTVSSRCIRDVGSLFSQNLTKSLTEFSGHFPSTFKRWTYADLGDYDGCLDTQFIFGAKKESMNTHYCLISLEPDLGKFSEQNIEQTRIKELIPPDFDTEMGQSMKIGLCIPLSCSSHDIDSALDDALIDQFWVRNAKTHCTTKKSFIQRFHSATEEQKISIFILVCLSSLTLVSGYLDFQDIHDASEKRSSMRIIQNIFSPLKSLREFGAPTNKKRWIFLDKMRLRNHLVIMAGHIVVWPEHLKWLPLIANFKNFQDLSTSFYVQPFINNFHSEKTIMIGAVSSTIAVWKKISWNTSVKTCLWLLIDRFLRFQGIFASLVLIKIALPVFDQGPVFEYFSQARSEICVKNSWYSIMHLTNFISHQDNCILHTWTFSAEFHLLIVAVFFILLVKRGLQVKKVLCSHIIILLFGYTIYVFYHESLIPIIIINPIRVREVYEYMSKFYILTSTHAWSYAASVLATLLIIEGYDRNFREAGIRKTFKILGFITACTLFSSYMFTFIEPSPLVSAIYIGIHFILFSLLSVFALFSQANELRACLKVANHSKDKLLVGMFDGKNQKLDENNNTLRRSETFPWFDVALKSTRNAYYVHDIVTMWMLARLREPIDYTSLDYLFMALMIIIWSYIVGFVFQIFVVSPSEKIHCKVMQFVSTEILKIEQ